MTLLVKRQLSAHVILVAAEPYTTVEEARAALEQLQRDTPDGCTLLITGLG